MPRTIRFSVIFAIAALCFSGALTLNVAARQAAMATGATAIDPIVWNALKWRSVGPERGGRSIAISGVKGRPPATILLLSGDVHYSYLASAGRIHQIVCSSIRNPLSRTLRLANVVASFAVAGPLGRLLASLARLPRPRRPDRALPRRRGDPS